MCHAVQIDYVLCTLYNLQTSASAPFFVSGMRSLMPKFLAVHDAN